MRDTAERWIPGISSKIRKIEGPNTIYEYLDKLPDSIRAGEAPLVIDCLNCEHGCNAGTATLVKHKSPDRLEKLVSDRKDQMKSRYLDNKEEGKSKLKLRFNNKASTKTITSEENIVQNNIEPCIDSYWKPGLYKRNYVNHSNTKINRNISETELKPIYKSMHKTKPEDFKNCSACGYGSCQDMAIAIYHNLNKAENCHHFLASEIANTRTAKQEQLTSITEKFTETLYALNEKLDTSQIHKEFQPIVSAITSMSIKINMLALNAAVEAARAGQAGAAFGVVAEEVRKLAQIAREEAEKIVPSSERIQNAFEDALKDANFAVEQVKQISHLAQTEN